MEPHTRSNPGGPEVVAVLFVCAGDRAGSPLSRSGSERITRVGWRCGPLLADAGWRRSSRTRSNRINIDGQRAGSAQHRYRPWLPGSVFAGALMIVSGIGAVFKGIAAVFNDGSS